MLLDEDGCKQQCGFTLEYRYQLPTSWFDPQEDNLETVMVTIYHVCFRCEQSALSFRCPETDSKTRDITTHLPSLFSLWASFTTSNRPTSAYWALNDWPHVPVESRTIRTRYSHRPSIAIATRTIRPHLILARSAAALALNHQVVVVFMLATPGTEIAHFLGVCAALAITAAAALRYPAAGVAVSTRSHSFVRGLGG